MGKTMTGPASDISIFDYTDYRRYLADFYHERKRASKIFSYRYFAKKAGINSVGLYKDVVEGRQRFGRALIFKFSNAMGHTKKEAGYFANMVFFNEADTVEERTLFFERMMDCQKTKARLVEATKYEYYHKWYYSKWRYGCIPANVFCGARCHHGILSLRHRPGTGCRRKMRGAGG